MGESASTVRFTFYSQAEAVGTEGVYPLEIQSGHVEMWQPVRDPEHLDRIHIQWPELPGLIQVQSIELFSGRDEPFPLWKCTADNNFHGLYQEGNQPLTRVAENVLIFLHGKPPALWAFVDPVGAELRWCRVRADIELGMERHLASKLASLFQAIIQDQRQKNQLRNIEAQELIESFQVLHGSYQTVVRSKTWQFTAALRNLRVLARKRARRVVKKMLQKLF